MQDTKIIATCYLYADNQNDELCICTTTSLQIKSKSKHIIAPLSDIKSLKIIKKKLLFPIIIGGVVAPFSLLAILLNLFNPEILQIILVLAGISFYYGFIGKDAIHHEYQAASEILILKKRMTHLVQFIEFINGCLLTSYNIDYANFYFFADDADAVRIDNGQDLDEKPRQFFTFQVLKRKKPKKLPSRTFSVNPAFLQGHVNFRDADGEALIEYLGPIQIGALRLING